jgi:hypothetical protein
VLGRDFAGFHFVHVAPDPGFTGFDGAHQRVLGVVEMLGRMFVLGRIATGGMSANKAHAQMDPGVAGFYAIFTDMFVGFSNLDLIEVGTFLLRHRFPPVFFSSVTLDRCKGVKFSYAA